MFATTMKHSTAVSRLLCHALVALAGLGAALAANAAAPGITGNSFGTSASTFNLTAQTANLTMPDGQYIYSWGYGCVANSAVSYAPFAGRCNTMQVPGPTLIVTEGQTVTVSLTNNLPAPAGNTSILFPGFNVTSSCGAATPAGVPGLLTCEAANGQTVTYTFVAGSPGTRAYYSGTQSDLQVEMGMYGAIIVLPASVPSVCGSATAPFASSSTGLPATNPGANFRARAAHGEGEFRLAAAAYDHPQACYDREYLFQFGEVDPNIHLQALAQVNALGTCTAGSQGCSLDIQTEPYHPAYFLLNGRSMPDNMDPNYSEQYPNQPYNSNPHIHPGENMLLRVIGQGRWQHPFHEHANHVRILAYDGNMVLSPGMVNVQSGPGGATASAPGLAGAPKYTTPTTPGVAFDGIFTFTGRGLNWDMFGHHHGSSDPLAELPCVPDVNGFNTGSPTAINYYEWCQDHNKPVQSAPFGDVATGGPMSLPDPNTFKQGPWYSGTPYFGPNAMARAVGQTGTSLPGTIQANPPSEAGWAFMWHSHNERELTTNNAFPGGYLDMMLVDSREFVIDETQ